MEEDIFRCFTQVKVAISQYKQVKIKYSMEKIGPCEWYDINNTIRLLDYYY